ncbi:MAG: glycosyltransferase family 4 protein [Gammaproteobacteria bacterium]|nr:glycosyltransferase family 4 protein [Gammaproteobacteria bacterium]
MMKFVARIALSMTYAFAICIASLLSLIVPKRRPASGRLLAIGTFHNPNWFMAHIPPLANCGIDEIIVVGDGFMQQLPNVRMVVPNRFVAAIFSRSVAKLIWGFGCAIKYKPDLYMGYAIFPAATWALLLSRLFGRPCCFQLTSGKLELEGGGNRAENRLLASLKTPSPLVERLAFTLTRQFDLMIVRGSQAEDYVRKLGYIGPVATITGSVTIPETVQGPGERDIDLIYVARLTRRKRPDRYIEIVKRVAQEIPGVKAVVVGDGPEYEPVRQQVIAAGLQDNVELLGLRHDVPDLVARSRLFVLTSRWEGLSIALLEAMSGAVVPVASDVGDLADVVKNGVTGYLYDEDDLDSFTKTIVDLLSNEELQTTLAMSARQAVIDKSGIQAVTQQWHDVLREYVAMRDNSRSV